MDLSFFPLTLDAIDKAAAESLCLFIASDERPLTGLAGLCDWRLSGRLSNLLRKGLVTGVAGFVGEDSGFVWAVNFPTPKRRKKMATQSAPDRKRMAMFCMTTWDRRFIARRLQRRLLGGGRLAETSELEMEPGPISSSFG